MKRPIHFCICLFLLAIGSAAQTPDTFEIATFDIATFQIPSGWSKQPSDSFFQISTQDKASGTFCVITIYRSGPGTGDSKENFDLAWKSIVKETVSPSAAPLMQPSKNRAGDWNAEMGSAPFDKDGTKGVAVLVTVSGFGKMLNTLILTNSDVYEPTITAFLESADLKKPDGDSNSVRRSEVNNAGLSVTSYSWKQSQSRKDPMGGYAGYSANTYQFLANNTYK